jgi:hypothetical protein
MGKISKTISQRQNSEQKFWDMTQVMKKLHSIQEALLGSIPSNAKKKKKKKKGINFSITCLGQPSPCFCFLNHGLVFVIFNLLVNSP